MTYFSKLSLATCFSVILLSACGTANNDIDSENHIKIDTFTEGSWIGYNGDEVSDEEMIISDVIPYDPENDYELTRSSYVSYYAGKEFLETKLYSGDPPLRIDSVEEADGIRLSFNQYNEDVIQLTEQ